MSAQTLAKTTVQHLPCNIAFDGPADVSSRFIARGADGLEAAFRGRKLKGLDVPLPAGTTGVVLDTSAGEARIRQTFDEVRVWGHDEAPAAGHVVLESLETIKALSALHQE